MVRTMTIPNSSVRERVMCVRTSRSPATAKLERTTLKPSPRSSGQGKAVEVAFEGGLLDDIFRHGKHLNVNGVEASFVVDSFTCIRESVACEMPGLSGSANCFQSGRKLAQANPVVRNSIEDGPKVRSFGQTKKIESVPFCTLMLSRLK
jgi:hypothetical protein